MKSQNLTTAEQVLCALASPYLSSLISCPLSWTALSSLVPWGLCPHCSLFLKPYPTPTLRLPGWDVFLNVTQARLDHSVIQGHWRCWLALTSKPQRTWILGPGKNIVTFMCHSMSLQVSISPLIKWGCNTHQTYKTVIKITNVTGKAL